MASEYKCVAAIDFGTTYSGFAFSFASDPEDIHLYWEWGTCMAIPRTCKAPTSVLVAEDGEFAAFGYEAYRAYNSMRPEAAAASSFFTHYKMHLHDTVPLKLDTELTAIGGQKRLALEIFGMTLKHLRECLLREIRKQTDMSNINPDDIQWVITVPAIWSEASKKFMRQAAVKGQIIGSWNSKQLTIALEPEAASLYCHTLNINVFDRDGESRGRMAEGTNYLVLDCGGGTLDITAHQLLPDFKVEELYHVSGGAMGGMLVNKEFEKLLDEIFGDTIMEEFKIENSPAWLHMINQFEVTKRSIDPYNPAQQATDITFHIKFVRFFERKKGVDITTVFTKDLETRGITGNEGQLQLTFDAMKNLYKPALDKILAYVENLLQKPQLKCITHMLIVGGFGESKVLQDAIKMHFQGNFKIMVPPEPSQCVLKGAIKFAYPPEKIIARRACKTYGYNTSEKFDAAVHDPNKVKDVEGTMYADGIFNIFIQKGQRVEAGTEKTVTLYPLRVKQKALNVGLYYSDDEPKYIDDDGVFKQAEVKIDLPGEGRDREVLAIFCFGDTEVDIQLMDPRDGGDMKGTKIDFLVE